MNGAPLPIRAGHREPPRREHIQALRNAADNLHRMLARVRDDDNAKALLIELAAHLEGMRQLAVAAAYMPGARTSAGGIPGAPQRPTDPTPPAAA